MEGASLVFCEGSFLGQFSTWLSLPAWGKATANRQAVISSNSEGILRSPKKVLSFFQATSRNMFVVTIGLVTNVFSQKQEWKTDDINSKHELWLMVA